MIEHALTHTVHSSCAQRLSSFLFGCLAHFQHVQNVVFGYSVISVSALVTLFASDGCLAEFSHFRLRPCFKMLMSCLLISKVARKFNVWKSLVRCFKATDTEINLLKMGLELSFMLSVMKCLSGLCSSEI